MANKAGSRLSKNRSNSRCFDILLTSFSGPITGKILLQQSVAEGSLLAEEATQPNPDAFQNGINSSSRRSDGQTRTAADIFTALLAEEATQPNPDQRRDRAAILLAEEATQPNPESPMNGVALPSDYKLIPITGYLLAEEATQPNPEIFGSLSVRTSSRRSDAAKPGLVGS